MTYNSSRAGGRPWLTPNRIARGLVPRAMNFTLLTTNILGGSFEPSYQSKIVDQDDLLSLEISVSKEGDTWYISVPLAADGSITPTPTWYVDDMTRDKERYWTEFTNKITQLENKLCDTHGVSAVDARNLLGPLRRNVSHIVNSWQFDAASFSLEQPSINPLISDVRYSEEENGLRVTLSAVLKKSEGEEFHSPPVFLKVLQPTE